MCEKVYQKYMYTYINGGCGYIESSQFQNNRIFSGSDTPRLPTKSTINSLVRNSIKDFQVRNKMVVAGIRKYVAGSTGYFQDRICLGDLLNTLNAITPPPGITYGLMYTRAQKLSTSGISLFKTSLKRLNSSLLRPD